eukprot:s636_g26.t1
MGSISPGHWNLNLAFLGQIEIQRLEVNSFGYGNVLRVLRPVQWLEVTTLLHGMQQRSIEVNEVCCSSAVSCFVRWDLWPLALAMTSASQRGPTRTAALTSCAESTQWQMALRFFSRGFADEVAYAAVITSCSEHWRRSLWLVHCMGRTHDTMSQNAFNAGIGVCGRSNWTWASFLLELMWRHRVHPESWNVLDLC